jgi:hypothetical protein
MAQPGRNYARGCSSSGRKHGSNSATIVATIVAKKSAGEHLGEFTHVFRLYNRVSPFENFIPIVDRW